MSNHSSEKAGGAPSSAAQQIPLDLRHVEALGREDYFVNESNENVLKWLNKWPDWPTPTFVIYGPKASGKTHLLSVWAEKSKQDVLKINDVLSNGWESYRDQKHMAIDDVHEAIGDRAKEEHLFHIYNQILANGGTLLLTSEATPKSLAFDLPDWASRMRAATSETIQEPDDGLLSIVLLKLFQDKKVAITDKEIQYIVPRIERSYAMAQHLVEEVNQASLSQKRPVTIPLIKTVMGSPNFNQEELYSDTQTNVL